MWKPSSWMNLTNFLVTLSITLSIKICHYAPRDHQFIYMSATTKFDAEQIEPNTLTIQVEGQSLDNIQHFYMEVDKREKVELLRKLSNVEDFRGLVFFNSLSDLGSAEEKLQYREVSAVSLASDVKRQIPESHSRTL